MTRWKLRSRLLCSTMVVIIVAGMFIPSRPARAITIHEEEELSVEFMTMARESLTLIDDFLIRDYVTRVGEKIVRILPTQPFAYHFYVVKDPTYNAFAGPGAHVFINSGLLAAMSSEADLAGILGHEISHVVCRHVSDSIDRQKKIGIATLAGIAAGLLLGAAGSAAIGNAASIGSMAAGQSIALSHSRDDEMQADQLGLDFLTKAGYNPNGLLEMLKKIRSQQWFGPKQIPTYLLTHPAVDDRIAYISSWIESHPKMPPAVATPDFILARTRLVALYENEDLAKRELEDSHKADPRSAWPLYGQALLALRMGHNEKATTLMRQALERQAFDPVVLTGMGRVYFGAGNYNEALSILDSAVSLAPDDSEAKFYLGKTQMELGKYPQAAETLQTVFRRYPEHRQTLYDLGKIYGAMGKDADAAYYLGLFYRLNAEYRNAVFQFQRALDMGIDPMKKEQIEKLLKECRKRGRFLTQESEQRQRNVTQVTPGTRMLRVR
jgi:predicted Zn-dependent protease